MRILIVVLSSFLAITLSLAQPPQTKPYQIDPAIQKVGTSPMQPYLAWFQADRGNLNRFYNITLSPTRQAQFRALYSQWQELLTRLPFDTFPQDAKIDYLLLKNYLTREQRQ